MTLEPTRCGQLPVVLPPAADELLSSWVRRHAVFYDVSPLVMLRHCRVDMSSLRAVDLRLTDEQVSRFASMFRTEVASVQRMSLSNISPKSRRFIAAKPMQFCANCSRQLNSNGSELTRRSQLLGWRLSCPQCGSALFDNRGHASTSPFAAYWTEALNGQRLIDDEAERGVRTWASPTELARLLLMRRDPRTGYSATNNNLRLLGGVLPDIDAVVANTRSPFLLRQTQSYRIGCARRCSRQSRSSSGRDRPCWRGCKAKRLVKTARASASSPRPCSAPQRSPRRYHYCSIFDNLLQNDSQISCSSAREPAHSCNYAQRDKRPRPCLNGEARAPPVYQLICDCHPFWSARPLPPSRPRSSRSGDSCCKSCGRHASNAVRRGTDWLALQSVSETFICRASIFGLTTWTCFGNEAADDFFQTSIDPAPEWDLLLILLGE